MRAESSRRDRPSPLQILPRHRLVCMIAAGIRVTWREGRVVWLIRCNGVIRSVRSRQP